MLEAVDHRGADGVRLVGLDLALPARGVTGLLGPPGAGKTTTLRLLLGIERARRGRVRVLGRDAGREGVALRAATGYVPQRLAFYEDLNAVELERFTGAFYPRWSPGRCWEVLQRGGVRPRVPAGRLAPLERAHLALALALGATPRALFVDLPEGLDPWAREAFLAALAAERGEVPLVLASAAPREVEHLVAHVRLLVAGRLRAAASKEDLLERTLRLELALGAQAPALPAGAQALAARPAQGERPACLWVELRGAPREALGGLPGVQRAAAVELEEALLARSQGG